MKYTLTKSAYVQSVRGTQPAKQKLSDTEPKIWFRTGETVSGDEKYLVIGKRMVRVVKLSANRYLPFELVEATASMSGREWQKGTRQQMAYGSGDMFYVERFSNQDGASDPKVVELTPAQAREQHKASGSKKPFGEWIKGEGKGWLIGFGHTLAGLLESGQPSGTTAGTGATAGNGDKPKEKDDKKFLGMHPVTFGVVALGTLALIGIGLMALGGKKGK